MPFGFGRGGDNWWRGWPGRGKSKKGMPGRPENCVCTVCGFVAKKEPGAPCYLMPCPKCGGRMARKFESGE
jgi:hypothetical protein